MATYTPDNSIIRQGDYASKTIKAGQTFSVLTPLMLDSTETTSLVVWDGTPGNEVYLSACEVDALVVNTDKAVITNGIYRISSINWPSGLTDAQKRAAFTGTAISVDE